MQKNFFSLDIPAFLAAWLCAMVIVMYPIFDPDLYWHLANGREMVNAGKVISEEVFSFTHAGEKFANHEWLGQVIFYLIWHKFGFSGLFALRLALASLAVFFIYRTARFVGAQPVLAGILAAFVVLVGMWRYHERPELFSLLNTALLTYLLFGFRAGQLSRKALWCIPVLLVVWDWLHGSVYGLTLLTVFVAGENAKRYLPALRQIQQLSADHLKLLNVWFGITLLAMLLNPFGLTSYGIFVGYVVGEADFNQVIMEFQPIWVSWGSYKSYLLMLAVASLLCLRQARRSDITQLMLLVVFTAAAMRFNRVTGVAAIVMSPIIAGLAVQWMQQSTSALKPKLHALALLCAATWVLGFGYFIKFKQANGYAFGYELNESLYPVGTVRFIKAVGLSGNLYNSGDFGGYLSLHITPERKIFQYNMGRVFGNPFRFAKHPEELAQWDINYAIVGRQSEINALFPAQGWAQVYHDPYATLVVRRTPQNQALINEYEMRYFNLNMSEADFRSMAYIPDVRLGLAFEMGVYLAYRQDDRVAEKWAELLTAWPSLKAQPRIQQLLKQALEWNGGKLGKVAT